MSTVFCDMARLIAIEAARLSIITGAVMVARDCAGGLV